MNSEKSQQQNGEFKKVLGLGSLIIFGLAYMAPTVVFNYYGPLSVASKGMFCHHGNSNVLYGIQLCEHVA